MAYRDDLYSYDNIIGYTGDLHGLPTVYFISEELQLVGHITQQHDIEENVGREKTRKLNGYRYENKANAMGKVVLHEYFAEGGNHTSRNPLIKVGVSENGRPQSVEIVMETMAILAQAIYNHQNAKAVTNPRIYARVYELIKSATHHGMKVSEIRTMGNLNDYSRVNFRGRRNWKRSF